MRPELSTRLKHLALPPGPIGEPWVAARMRELRRELAAQEGGST